MVLSLKESDISAGIYGNSGYLSRGVKVLWLSGDAIEADMDYGWKNRNDGCNHVGAYSNG